MWEREEEYSKRNNTKQTVFKSGREERRERRKLDRKKNKN